MWGLSIPLQRWFPGIIVWVLWLMIGYGVFSLVQFFSEQPRWKTALRAMLGFGLYLFANMVLAVVAVIVMFGMPRHAR